MTLILSSRAYERHASELSALGYRLSPLEPLEGLDPIVADHADTLIFAAKDVLLSAVKLDLPHLLAVHVPKSGYPRDISLNALALGSKLYGRLDALAPELLELAGKLSLERVNVRQGYARCSTLPLEPSAAISADQSMLAAMRRYVVDTLEIEPGHIRLDGCEYGFIGGASVVDNHVRRVIFYGSLDSHPDGVRIRGFCRDHGYEPLELSGELTDFGGGIITDRG